MSRTNHASKAHSGQAVPPTRRGVTLDRIRKGIQGLLVACLLLAVVSIIPAPSEAYAASSYYVAKSGSDTTGDGSSARPWASIQKAANSVSAGATVHVGAGTYNERVTIPVTKSGSASAMTRFVADGAVVVTKGLVVNSSYTEVSGFEITPGASGLYFRDGQVHVTGSNNLLSGLNIHDIVSGSGVSFQNGASYNTVTDFRVHRSPEYAVVFGKHSSAGGNYSTAMYNTASNGTITEAGGWSGVEMSGSYNICDGLTIAGPSGWNTASNGTSSSQPYPNGDGIRVQGPNSIIRNCTIHDLWEMYHDTQHTDCIQFWTDADGLLIENCLLGTWEPGPTPAERGGLAQEIGPSQCIMAEAKTGQNITFTVRNTIFLGECGTRATIVTVAQSGGSLKAYLYNNTFWSSRPSLTGAPGSVMRNNIFRSYSSYPTSLILDSDNNAYCWVGGTSANNIPLNEGPNSIGKTYATKVDPQFVNPDISAATGYGLHADFTLKAGSPAAGRGAAWPVGAGSASIPPVVEADTTAPVTSASTDVSVSFGGWYPSIPLVSLSADESAVTSYQWDGTGGSWSTYSAPVPALQGTHTLYFYSTDTAGNAEAVKSLTLWVDAAAPTAPEVESSTHPDADVPSSEDLAVFSFVAYDDVSGVSGYSYTLDQSTSTTPDTKSEGAGSSVSLPVTSDGAWYFHVRAVDAAGKWGPVTHRKISVASTASASAETPAPSDSEKTQPALTLTASATKVMPNRYVTLTSEYRVADVSAQATAPVSVWAYAGGIWKQIGVATYDDASKTYKYQVRVQKSSIFRMRCDADAQCYAVDSNAVSVTVGR
jgi:hypothetical protein